MDEQTKTITAKPLVKFIGKVTPSCKVVTQLISESMDRDLTLKERVQLYLHYKICWLCIRYKNQVETLHNGMAGKEDEAVAARCECLSKASYDRLKTCLETEIARDKEDRSESS